MEIKIDTEALSNNNNANKAASSQIIEEMLNFHLNEIDQYLLKQENKYFITEYFIVKINFLLIENSEEKSLILLGEIKECFQTLYDYKPKDKVFVYSKSSDFFNRLISMIHKSTKKNINHFSNDKKNNMGNNSNSLNLNFSKKDFESGFINSQNSPENSASDYFSKFQINNLEIRIDLDETIFIPANEVLNCLSLYYNIHKDEINDSEAKKREYLDKIFFIMISISNIIKIYYFYYKKFKFNKWDSFLINTVFYEEAFILSLLLNFIGLKVVINKSAIKNNFESLAFADINDYIFEIENIDLFLQNDKTKNSFLRKEEEENDFNYDNSESKNNNMEYFYSNFLKNIQIF